MDATNMQLKLLLSFIRHRLFPSPTINVVSIGRPNHQLEWCLLLCLLLNGVVTASAAEYEVDGQIEQTLYQRDGGVQSVEQAKFTVFVRDCSWLIQTTFLDKDGKPTFRNETACTNGAQIYSVGVNIGKNNAPGGRPEIPGLNVANIYSNTVPVGETDDYFICHLWQMFASGCYFENNTTNWLTPAYDLNASAPVHPDLKREAKWELINGPGSLPLKVVYLENDRRTNATYVATGVTNVDSLKIPSGFIFELRIGSINFAPGPIAPGESAPTYRVRKQAIAMVTAVRPACTRVELMPQVQPGKTIVIDERLARSTNPAPVFYNFQKGVKWVSVEESKKLAIPQSPPRQHNPTVARAVFFVLLILPLVALGYFFLIKTKRK